MIVIQVNGVLDGKSMISRYCMFSIDHFRHNLLLVLNETNNLSPSTSTFGDFSFKISVLARGVSSRLCFVDEEYAFFEGPFLRRIANNDSQNQDVFRHKDNLGIG